jgi:flagellar hook protein FlgE
MSFQQGLSGLNATSKSLDVIGNNIANANTYGAKVARAEFSDMYAAQLGGTGENVIGIGTKLAAVDNFYYASCYIYTSENSGATWTARFTPTPYASQYWIAIISSSTFDLYI